MSDLVSSDGDKTLSEKSQKTLLASQVLGGAVVICLAGAAFSTGFIYSLARSQKKLSTSVSKTVSINAYASALKALFLGSAAAVSAVGGTVFATCKLVGISSLEDLRTLNRKGSKLNIPHPSSVGRSEFANLQELADYLVGRAKVVDFFVRRFRTDCRNGDGQLVSPAGWRKSRQSEHCAQIVRQDNFIHNRPSG
ncbi:conserved hypothetical protein [Trichinella spiralis]|uniref:hypothetical protein n=1 Tax=Trichinella spiralis TaxID=6334 RepID=UPI0001EFE7E9|nr:conserved hypothetical protein [Trichinella spiralis]